MHEALLVVVAHMLAASLGVDLLTVTGIKDRLTRLNRDLLKLLEKSQFGDFLRSVGLDVDPDAQRLEGVHPFVDLGPKSLLVQPQSGSQTGRSRTDNRDIQHDSI